MHGAGIDATEPIQNTGMATMVPDACPAASGEGTPVGMIQS
jgi:hypothetical protein